MTYIITGYFLVGLLAWVGVVSNDRQFMIIDFFAAIMWIVCWPILLFVREVCIMIIDLAKEKK